jgi:C-terminal processing protease CtpA/Prc
LLIGAATGSSGEFLAIALKGRHKTLFIGTSTAGYVTVVGGFDLHEKGFMYISTGYGTDRNGNIYKKAIEPDITIAAPDSFNDLSNDAKVRAAIRWLTATF